MSVSVASCTLEQIFNDDVIYSSCGKPIKGRLTIPEYQRSYRWTEKQLQRLWQDYRTYLSEVSNSDASDYAYYLGSVILHQNVEGELNVIDGQQRLTTLGLLLWLKCKVVGGEFELSLSFDSPESQQQIQHNLAWILENLSKEITSFDPANINLTLVVTESEDDAYRFFETQNTGGVRLVGPPCQAFSVNVKKIELMKRKSNLIENLIY